MRFNNVIPAAVCNVPLLTRNNCLINKYQVVLKKLFYFCLHSQHPIL